MYNKNKNGVANNITVFLFHWRVFVMELKELLQYYPCIPCFLSPFHKVEINNINLTNKKKT